MVALVGLPGAGKSTVAGDLAARFGLALVDRDQIRREMFPGERVCFETTQAATREVLARVRNNARERRSSIVDGMTLAREVDRSRLRSAAEALGARVVFVWLDCPVEVACRRVAEDPAHPANDRTPVLVREVAARFEVPQDAAVRLDAGATIDVVRAQALRALQPLLARGRGN